MRREKSIVNPIFIQKFDKKKKSRGEGGGRRLQELILFHPEYVGQ